MCGRRTPTNGLGLSMGDQRVPEWRKKHPCTNCDTGYGVCVHGLALDLQCCKHCHHPGRWGAQPYTPEDLAEMQANADDWKPTL